MPTWLSRPICLIALIYALRVFGFMVILPALTLYPNHYADSSMIALGWAIGVYGFTQAVCQVPMGALSDRFGRKPITLVGLGGWSLFLVFSHRPTHCHSYWL